MTQATPFKPTLVKTHADEQAETYEAALLLVRHIDQTLTNGTQHYRTKSGQLLRTLDEVVNAILDNNLLWDTGEVVEEEELARAA